MFDFRLMQAAGRSAFNAWLDAGAAMATIMMRGPIVAADPFGGEAQRMVAEKAVAAGQAMAAAGLAMAQASLAPPVTAAGAVRAAMRVAEKAARPARRKVRANARRLARRTRC